MAMNTSCRSSLTWGGRCRSAMSRASTEEGEMEEHRDVPVRQLWSVWHGTDLLVPTGFGDEDGDPLQLAFELLQDQWCTL
jgi:hypothetical protein